tara:strand:- start:58 stop:342 length:285 start_codon:yes stop_codon:yes gene_type:complete
MERNFLITIGTLTEAHIITLRAKVITQTGIVTDTRIVIELTQTTIDAIGIKQLIAIALIQKSHHRRPPPRNRVRKEKRNGENINFNIRFSFNRL